MMEGDEIIVDKILNHTKTGRGNQFLTLVKGSPEHDAEWRPVSNFIDADGTMYDNIYRILSRKIK